MGQFRDRMDDELRLRGYSASTRECYVGCVRHFARHFMPPPDQLTREQIRQYQLYLTRDRHVVWSYFKVAMTGPPTPKVLDPWAPLPSRPDSRRWHGSARPSSPSRAGSAA